LPYDNIVQGAEKNSPLNYGLFYISGVPGVIREFKVYHKKRGNQFGNPFF